MHLDKLLRLDEINDRAAFEASASWGESDVAKPSSSITTGKGMITVQRRLSTRETNIERDDKRRFVSMTSTVKPGTMTFVGLGGGFLVRGGRLEDWGAAWNLSLADCKMLRR